MKSIEMIQKGDYLTPAEIEEFTDQIEGTQAYQFALMQLRQFIELRLANLGRPVTIKAERNGLRILLDAEAADYNARQGDLARFKLFRAFRRNQAVDEGELTLMERHGHYRVLEVQGKYVQALKQIRREAECQPVRRQTPGIVSY